ncbi:hypothetical protein LIA77_07191 [Sarocladium implicatum]|nr:hypothetical protein LIA77_07191 [Sarocladium implicatum]
MPGPLKATASSRLSLGSEPTQVKPDWAKHATVAHHSIDHPHSGGTLRGDTTCCRHESPTFANPEKDESLHPRRLVAAKGVVVE